MKYLFIALVFLSRMALANEPDTAYLFAYTTTKDNGRSGLHFAWSPDKQHWLLVGNEQAYVRSDYGRWGSQKQMNQPYLLKGANDEWQCIWSLNNDVNQLAHAASADLVSWGRQSYPYLKETAAFQQPVVHYDAGTKQYTIQYRTAGKYYEVKTSDFKILGAATEIPAARYADDRVTLNLPTGPFAGQLYRVDRKVIDKLETAYKARQYSNSRNEEGAQQDPQRFAGLKPVEATVTVQPEKAKPISDMLLGIFFEDINYAADGGLYAELVQNRDFEYQPGDKEGQDKNWNTTHSWSIKGENTDFEIARSGPIHPNNPNYALLHVKQTGAALVNTGFDGIAVKKGEVYHCTLFAKQPDGKGKKIRLSLVNKAGAIIARTEVNTASAGWKKYSAVLTANADATEAQLEIEPLSKGQIALDLISLFPQRTFNNRKNGLRSDLAQTIAAIHPRFVRFPGGCVAHGDGLQNIYQWKNTIGSVEARKPQRNLWGYHQSAGLGYFEYFQFCEDIGAEPVPVVAAGVPCQNSGNVAGVGGGQQGGIPMSDMDAYVQDVLDLVEYANGPVNSRWGKLRAEAGHPKPFNLKYIGIGNEDLITDLFEERFAMIFNAMKKVHPEIRVIGTVGPSAEGTDYEQGWDLATRMNVPMVDEHYYQSPGWFINNQNYYDTYDRSKSKVYLGEYASWGSQFYNALAEALYLTGLERNGDVVSMASYAPLLAKEGHTQWNPDLIYFNNTDVKPTVCYEVQKLYGNNSGSRYLPATISLSNNQEAVQKRLGISVVKETASGDLIVKMVNLLPVATRTRVNLAGAGTLQPAAMKTVLQGQPGDRKVDPVTTPVQVAESFTEELPAYSFTVIRIKTK